MEKEYSLLWLVTRTLRIYLRILSFLIFIYNASSASIITQRLTDEKRNTFISFFRNISTDLKSNKREMEEK